MDLRFRSALFFGVLVSTSARAQTVAELVSYPEDVDFERSCSAIHSEFNVNTAARPKFIDEQEFGEIEILNCEAFKSKYLRETKLGRAGILTRTGILTRSVKLSERCTFENTEIKIAAPNLVFDCGGSTFSGGSPDERVLNIGLSFIQNDASGASAVEKKIPLIQNVAVRNCEFRDYKTSGVFLANMFSRTNPHDVDFYNKVLLPMYEDDIMDIPGKPSRADAIRKLSPRNISLHNISVRNTDNAGIYIQNSLWNVEINRAKVSYTRSGVYLDFGSRNIVIQNSCFLRVGFVDPLRPTRFPDKSFGESASAPGKPGREGVCVDASARNRIANNLFYRNKAGAVHVYKNFWESFGKYLNGFRDPSKPLLPMEMSKLWEEFYYGPKRGPLPQLAQFPRQQPADENVIQGNLIIGGERGVSLAQRQWSMMLYTHPDPMVTTAFNGDRFVEQVVGSDGSVRRRYRDYARNNQVRKNTFVDVRYPIIVQDDDNLVEGNIFKGERTPGSNRVLIRLARAGDVKYRGRSLKGVRILGNVSEVAGLDPVKSFFQFGSYSRFSTYVDGNSHMGTSIEPHSTLDTIGK